MTTSPPDRFPITFIDGVAAAVPFPARTPPEDVTRSTAPARSVPPARQIVTPRTAAQPDTTGPGGDVPTRTRGHRTEQVTTGPPLIVATDGACSGNPGPGGWAWYIDKDTWAGGGVPHTTNNIMELSAVKEILAATADQPHRPLILQVDSAYVISCLTQWIHGWRRKGWKTKDGNDVANQDLLRTIDDMMRGRTVTFEKVKGHSGHPLNDAVDAKACQGRDDARRTGQANHFGPGLHR